MSLKKLLKRAKQGDADAQYKVGRFFYARQKYTRSMEYLQLSANQNHPKALNSVGYRYYCGRGVAENNNEAFKYFLLSAEQKCPAGYFNVAHCYEKGYGVAKDLKQALKYYYLRGNKNSIGECELLILKQFSEMLNETDYVYAYPLYVKHNYKGLDKLKILLNAKYVEAMHFMPSVLSGIIISFLL